MSKFNKDHVLAAFNRFPPKTALTSRQLAITVLDDRYRLPPFEMAATMAGWSPPVVAWHHDSDYRSIIQIINALIDDHVLIIDKDWKIRKKEPCRCDQ